MQRGFITALAFGCKVNQYDSSELISLCEKAGWNYVDDPSDADLIIVHTCAVTEESVRQARQRIKSLHRTYPGLKIIVSGCAPELDSQIWKEMDGVEFVSGVADHESLKSHLKLNPRCDLVPKQKRARYFLKIQDGCDHACSYCVIRIARGRARSKKKEWVLEQYRRIADMGINEVVITGIHLGDYGRDLGCGGSDLFDLLCSLLEHDGPRIRLSSLHPNEVSDGLVSLLKNEPRLCRHVHLSVQSLSDPVLAAMNRHYDASSAMSLIKRLASEVDGVFIAADIITGFPNESDEYFSQTHDFLKSLPISSLHVFPFSSRPNTPASLLRNQCARGAVKERVSMLRNLSKEKWLAFAQGQIEKPLNVIVTDEDGEFVSALSDNYLNIKLPRIAVKYGDIKKAVIESVTKMEVVGKWQ